ncbi:TolC family outer membrane protein [Balneatrix alpica]|uniref:TolC family outer membrane protein n=1 Tax=Balneatrix alpica TaxID=75684 RepID=A0ABV5ZF62_9GAMM|nr:TolC family outer membrane protein [Balneatrix alpica]
MSSGKRFSQTLIALAVAGSATVWAKPLPEVVKEAVQSSPLVEQARFDKQTFEQAVKEARAGYLPSLDLRMGIGREHTKDRAGQSINKTLTRRESELALTQVLFDGFGTQAEVARQEARADAAAWMLAGETERVGLEVARAYLDVYRERELLRLAEENLTKHQSIYDQIQIRRQSGIASQAELAQAESRLALAQSNTIAARNNLKDVEARYQLMVGQAADEVSFPDFNSALLPASIDAAVEMALENNAILKAATSDIGEAQAQIETRNSLFMPRVTFEAKTSLDKNLDGNEGRNSDWEAMVRLNYNIFNGGADRSRQQQAREQLSKAKAIRDQTHREVTETMQLAWSAYELLGEQVNYLDRQVGSAQQTRELYKQQFNIGQRSLLDLLDSENELFEARNNLLGAQAAYRLAQYRILAASSKLLASMDDQSFTASTAYVSDPVEAQPVDASADYQEVMAAIESWRQAWAGQDIDGYLAQYSSEFKPSKGSVDVWQAQRRKAVSSPQWIQVDITEPAVAVVDTMATVSFTQSYKANHYSDVVTKQLRLQKENGEWKIVEENVL